MDKSWMNKSRLSNEYDLGVHSFLDFAFTHVGYGHKIVCPCVNCRLVIPVTREVAYDHLICDGFVEGYTKWELHGEGPSSSTPPIENNGHNSPDINIDMHGLLHDAFGMGGNVTNNETHAQENVGDRPNPEAEKFYRLVEESEKELYPGCKKYTMLSFVVRLYHIKCLGGISDNHFNMLFELFKTALPEGENLPKSLYEMKKLIKQLGLNYEKIHTCPNDCILYMNVHKDDVECHVCKKSRYVTPEVISSTTKSHKVPAKVLRYFPLIPRLQRLFMSSKTAPFMKWHKDGRTFDGYMRHPADSPTWITFDYKYPDFSSECQNVRLAAASDGMNPFGTMSTVHSTWPVVLVPLNLPPWMCMKPSNVILSMIIPGPDAPGNNMDVYLQPLVDELKILWETRVDTYDASAKQNFKMRAAMLWTISDFPAYANLSGWSTKGKYACPSCHKETCFQRLKYGRKFCYMGHRRFLDIRHPFRDDEKSFDGTKEKRSSPIPLNGSTILDMLDGVEIKFGKTSKNPDLPFNWKKRSIFFELPYWKHNLIRHNLDVMHIEKNVCESIIGTLLNVEGKSKDSLNARLDLEHLGLRSELHPKKNGDDIFLLPPACFSLTKEEKLTFCKFLKTIKVPDGYASNISRCVNLKQRNIYGLKSHDCHILMTQLLPLAVRGLLEPHVSSCLNELSKFFRDMYSKASKPQDFAHLQREIPKTLCKLEKIFPPAFFDIMVHLVVHLPSEAKIGGPVQYRDMYPIERYLKKLKSFVKSKSHPEGSIAEKYLADECLTFCSRYIENSEPGLTYMSRNYDEGPSVTNVLPIFSMPGRPLGKGDTFLLDENTMEKAHRYVLFNCNAIDDYIEYHRSHIHGKNPRLREMTIEREHSKKFPFWFRKQVEQQRSLVNDDITEDVKCLARGPIHIARRYKRFVINGFRFHTKEIERIRKTQNSGVVVTAKTQSFASASDRNPILGDVTFYGVLTDIIELDYLMERKVVLFKCEWVSQSGVRKDGDFTLVNFTRLMNDREPFVLASQAEQVMYVQDLKNKGWEVVIKINTRDFYNMNSLTPMEDTDDNVETLLQSVISCTTSGDFDDNFNLVRLDIPGITINTTPPEREADDVEDDDNEDEPFELLI